MLNNLIKEATHLYARFTHKTNFIATPQLCCIHLHSNTISLASISRKSGQPDLLLCDISSYQKEEDFSTALALLVKKNHLENVPCSLLLNSEQYQLLQIEALPVTPAEFQAAIRWKIKDLIHIPLNDAVIDHFPMPLQKTANPQKMMTVVVASLNYLQKISDKIKTCGLNLTTIDIPELGLRNIAGLYERDEKSTALIYLQENQNQLLITRQKNVYFSRRLEAGLETNLDKLALEVQRSFDYYQSQWRQPPPANVVFATTSLDLVKDLSQRLTTPVEILDLAQQMTVLQKLDLQQQTNYLLAIGGALRENGGADATTN